MENGPKTGPLCCTVHVFKMPVLAIYEFKCYQKRLHEHHCIENLLNMSVVLCKVHLRPRPWHYYSLMPRAHKTFCYTLYHWRSNHQQTSFALLQFRVQTDRGRRLSFRLLARLANLPEWLYILPMFFSLFIYVYTYLTTKKVKYTGCANKQQSPRKILYFSHGSMDFSHSKLSDFLCEYSRKIFCEFYWNNRHSSSDIVV